MVLPGAITGSALARGAQGDGVGLLGPEGIEARGDSPSPSARTAAARSAALTAPARPIASVPTGMPAGIWTIERRLSWPDRAFDLDRDAEDRQGRQRGGHARQVGGPAGPGDDDLEALGLGALRKCEKPFGRPVRRDDAGLETDAQALERLGGMAHRCPVGLAAHDDGDGVPRHDAAPLAASKKCGNSQAFTLKQGCRSRLQRFAVSQPSLGLHQTKAAAHADRELGAGDVRSELSALRTEVERLAAELTDMRAHAASLEALAQEDPLTGLLNRRGFFRDVARAIAYRARYGTQIGLLLADLDGFKGINDQHGHETGDRALIHLATLIRNNVRASDSVGRLGGDEFAVILWQVDEVSARQKAASLEAMISGDPARSKAASRFP